MCVLYALVILNLVQADDVDDELLEESEELKEDSDDSVNADESVLSDLLDDDSVSADESVLSDLLDDDSVLSDLLDDDGTSNGTGVSVKYSSPSSRSYSITILASCSIRGATRKLIIE